MFTFYLDLDELEDISKSIFMYSNNRFNIFSFYNKDHILNGCASLKESISQIAMQNGCKQKIHKVFLLTNIKVLGYVFNPVSFYFCYDESGKPICAIPEVNNTFGEMKPYYIEPNNENLDLFYLRVKKYFYVSPFLDLDTDFEFELNSPTNKLDIRVDVYKGDKKILLSTFKGNKEILNNKNIIRLFFQYPFVTLKVIGMIHYQAAKLFLMKIPFHKKMENTELQKGVYNGKNFK